jgi:N-acetylneuraminate synthase
MPDRVPFVIAEAGVNHNGQVDLALQLVDVAADAGADAVKFQTFRASELATRAAPKVAYQKDRTGVGDGQLEMLRSLELGADAHAKIAERCNARQIEFMSTPFDVESVALLNGLGVRRIKVPSGELTNPVLLRAVAGTGKPLIVSTGMATLGEIEVALSVIANASSGTGPQRKEHNRWDDIVASALGDRVTLLHCTSQYPAPYAEVNLRAMQTMQEAFSLPVGYSDHTTGKVIACAAVALGATVIEKHFTLDRSMPGPDHAASLEPSQLREFVTALRSVQLALGSGRKAPVASELETRRLSRRSLVAAKDVKRGEVFTLENLALKRPGTGISAERYYDFIGRAALRDYGVDELIDD